MLVLNATYEPINVCTVRRAVVLLLKEKAEVIEHAEFELHSATTTIHRPSSRISSQTAAPPLPTRRSHRLRQRVGARSIANW